MQDKRLNPFVNGLIVPYVQHLRRIDNKLEEAYRTEAEPYVRIYNTKEKREFMFRNLSMYARDMVTAIQYFLHSDNHYVILTYEKINELYGDGIIGRRRYDDTVRELIRMCIIDYKDKARNQFWYNASFFCQRSRIDLFPECAVKVNTVIDNS